MKKRRSGVVSVVLVNFRGTDDTITCIEGLRALNWPQDKLEIVVVENGSGDDSLERLKALGDTITLIDSGANLGFTGGCNLGVEKSSGEFVAFLNNDARPHQDWILEAVRTFDSGQDIGAVASKVLDWEGVNIDYAAASITWYGMGYKPQAGSPDNGSLDDERDVLFGTGAAMFMRGTVFEELGGFDDNFFMFYDDVDLGWRMNLLGYRFRYQPKSLAYHKHHASMNKFGNFRETYLLERNALFTLYKNLDDESLARVLPGALSLALRRAVARGELDSESLDLRNPGDDSQETMPVSKQTMAGIFAMDQFVEKLPEMQAAREQVQATRTRSDRQLSPLFGKTDEPAYPIENYLRGYDKIVSTLGQLDVGGRRRVLIITGDTIGLKMAGPAIRAWNMANLLSKEHDVRLVTMGNATITDPNFTIATVDRHRPKSIVQHEQWADVIIFQGHASVVFPAIATSQKVLVVDVYDPMHLEQLEQARELGMNRWNKQIKDATELLNSQLVLGDFFLAASERQRHFWLGQLSAVGRVNAFTYSRDGDLGSLIAIAPFGLSSDAPVKTKPAMRGVVPGIGEDDKIIIWAGGIYNWFDPETLIRAVAKVSKKHDNLKLFFMGVKHPNPDVPEMEVVSRARAVAEAEGITGTNVFFNEVWVDYNERQNYLLEADAGVSTHFQHVETTFSFRTRILDYLWAGLPIITTEGDSFGDLVSQQKLGVSVPERDVDALAEAIEKTLFDEKFQAAARKNVARVRKDFFWEKAMAPLIEFCRNPVHSADKAPGVKSSAAVAQVSFAPARRPGKLAQDIRATVFYLKEGGVRAVASRVKKRLTR
ncbi:GT2 family glycosyltransferase/glycosyltransferase involved in cell wall biosynthesis [Mycetocola sp. BIGb0189]|uniref:glycosyltransferase n=1 Tax=Mycetocola sp. BIGb0189 TaxID=2940604 RepID=UPI0021679B39|nr:glycosyltransferase [Mycetocola sp. BIGb0189]MCS4276778.1 GT2 family glycosyltransferase/glycosyltransferase involved in cell wall biosynthesis [Mycetocola sp. BIGb0189]